MARLRCVWWNLENLFAYDASQTADYRPASEDEYQSKLDDLAGVLMDMPEGVPDLILVCEVATAEKVDNRDALGDLAGRLGGNRGHYLGEAGDTRGITCGAIWNGDLVESTTAPTLHTVTEEMLGTERGRPILELSLCGRQSGLELTVYLNHWKSRRGDSAQTEAKRIVAARELIGLVQRRVWTRSNPDADPEALILVAGDFNDEPYNQSLTDPTWENAHLFVTRDRRQVMDRRPDRASPVLYNPSWRLLGQMLSCGDEAANGGHLPAGSYRYDAPYPDWWGTFDQVLVSAGMLRGASPVFDDESLEIYCRTELLGRTGKPQGPSDHLPITFALDF